MIITIIIINIICNFGLPLVGQQYLLILNSRQEMVWLLRDKSIRWNFVESLEPPRVVHVRTTEMLSKENIYAQVTVRFLTKQVSELHLSFREIGIVIIINSSSPFNIHDPRYYTQVWDIRQASVHAGTGQMGCWL